MKFIILFYEFFKVGLFSVGGGLATLPFLYNLAGKYNWFTVGDVTNMIAIAESTPGPIGVNMSTYAGYLVGGVPGGIIATVGLITPSIIVILIIANLLKKFKDNKYVNAAFFGLRPASLAMIASAGIGVVKVTLVHLDQFSLTHSLTDLFFIPGIILAGVIFMLSKKTKVSPVLLIALAGVVGVVFKFAGA